MATASAAGVAVLLAIYLGVGMWARMPPVERLPPEARAEAMALLAKARDTAEPLPERMSHQALRREVQGPVFVKLHLGGEVPFAYQSAVPVVIGEALLDAARRIREDARVKAVATSERRRSRFKVDVAQGRAPVVTSPEILFAISLIPGVDGLGVRVGGKTAYLDPDTLLRRGLVTGYKPFKFVPDFKAGLHISEADELLARQVGLWKDGRFQGGEREYFRFRTAGFVEAHWRGGRRGAPLRVYRGNTPPPVFSRSAVIRSCVQGGEYILRHLATRRQQVTMRYRFKPGKRPQLLTHALPPGWQVRSMRRPLARGQFRYIYYPLTDNYEAAGYSLPRHAGTTYALALLYGKLKGRPGVSDEQLARFRQGAETAIGYLADMVRKGRCRSEEHGFVCVSRGRWTDLGSSALPLVAVMEYQRQTGDRQYADLGRRLANFLLFMQKPGGEFCHRYDVQRGWRDPRTKLLYYSGEAALALAMAYKGLGDRRYLEATRKALDYLTGENYWPLPLKFLYGEDHWTCIAAEEAWPNLKRDHYAEFCYGFAAFQRRHQFYPGEAYADYVGGYGITPFFPPHLTPAGSRSEAMVSTYDLSRHRGEPREAIRGQIVRAFRYIVRHQIRRENAYLLADPGTALGGIPKSPIKHEIRIDYVQHTVAAMVRALDLVPEEPSLMPLE